MCFGRLINCRSEEVQEETGHEAEDVDQYIYRHRVASKSDRLAYMLPRIGRCCRNLLLHNASASFHYCAMLLTDLP